MSRYAKKTDRRPYEERSFSVRAVHRDRADLHPRPGLDVLDLEPLRVVVEVPAPYQERAVPLRHRRPSGRSQRVVAQREQMKRRLRCCLIVDGVSLRILCSG